MAGSRRSRRRGQSSRAVDDAPDSDDASVGGLSIGGDEVGVEGANGTADEASLGDCVEELSEKRYDTREKAYPKITSALQQDLQEDFLGQYRETLSMRIAGSLRKGGSRELRLAAECASALAVSLGADDSCESAWRDLHPHLVKIAKSGRNDDARAACVQALGTLCFVGAEEPSELEECEELFTATLCSSSVEAFPKTIEALIGSSALVAGRISFSWIQVNVLDRLINRMTEMLDHADLAARTSAGEGLCAFAEMSLQAKHAIDVVPALERVRELAAQTGHSMAKRDRATQRARFRDIRDFLETAIFTVYEKKFANVVLKVDSWKCEARLRMLTCALGSGIAAHCTASSFVAAVLGSALVAAPARLSGSRAERRLEMSPNSPAAKASTLQRKTQRRAKAYVSGALGE